MAADKTIGPISNPGAQTSAAAAGLPNWDSLKIGQSINGAAVLDAKTFQDQLISKYTSGSVDFDRPIVGGNKADLDKLAPTLGRSLSNDTTVSLYGFKPDEFFKGVGTGTEGQALDQSQSWDLAGLKKAATASGLDLSKYTTAGGVVYGEGENKGVNTISPDVLDAKKLQNDLTAAQYKKAASDPNALYIVDSQRPNTDSALNRAVTFYAQRGGRLVPVQNTEYKQTSGHIEAARGIGEVALMAVSAYLGPAVAAYFGGGVTGAAAAGAASGALNAGINGGNILKGAAIGGLSGGLGSAAGGAIASETGSQLAGKIAGGATGAFASATLNGSKSPGISAIIGGVSGANIGSQVGLDPVSGGFLNQIVGGTLRKKLVPG